MRSFTTTALRRWPLAFAVAGSLAIQAPVVRAQRHVTSPKEQFGFTIGDDYKLATYSQFEQYWRTLATQSNRMKLVEIGKTAEGRPQLMAIISAPANLARLDRYKQISQKLAHAEGRRSSGSMAACTRLRCSAPHSSSRRCISFSAETTRKRCGSSTTASSSPSMRIRTGWSSCPTGT
jgi:hypothetical protein